MLALRTSSIAVVVALTLWPGRGDAQGLYYRTIPIGERAIGLGGAYTGISDDPSATYYNPAGLMVGGRFALLGSLSSIVFARQKVENAFDSPIARSDFSSSRTTTLPHFIGTVVKFGKKLHGDFRYAIAYSSFEVARERFNVGFTQVDPEGSVDLRLNDDYRMRWWGVSFAMQATRKVSVGLTAFLSSQDYGYNEELGLALGGTLEPTGVRVDGESITSRTGIGLTSWDFVFRLGALYRINAKWQIGFMFQPPGAAIKTNGSVFRRLTADLIQGSRFLVVDEGDLNTRLPIPFELRTGIEYRINGLTTLAVDVSVTGPVRDTDRLSPPVQLEGQPLSLGAYFANTTKRRTTPNIAIGCEHLFGKVVVAGGLFTNISSAPNVPETSTEYVPDQISMFGASVAVGVDTKGYRLTVGATGYFGRGDALAYNINREAEVQGYRRTKSNISGLVLYIAGAVSVASRGAQDVQKKYRERKARKQGEENGEAEGDTGADTGAGTDAGADADAGADTGADADAGAGNDSQPAPAPASAPASDAAADQP